LIDNPEVDIGIHAPEANVSMAMSWVDSEKWRKDKGTKGKGEGRK
jgi:predicted transcriptional regulator